MTARASHVAARDVRRVHRGPDGSLVVLDDVNLDIPPGQSLSITGPSGSGKTTLLHCLAGLDRVDGGSVSIDGVDLATISDHERSLLRARTMGFVFQSSNLIPVLTAEQNVALVLRLNGTPKGRAQRQAREQLERLGLGDRCRHLPAQLSGGEQQRVAVARATVHAPLVLWADEPTGNLDSAASASVLELFTQAQDGGTTLVLVTHDEDVAAHAQRRIHLRDGHIVDDSLVPG